MQYLFSKNFKEPKNSKNIYIFFHGFGSSSCLGEFENTDPKIIPVLQEFDKGCGILTFDFIGHGKSMKKNTIITPSEEISNIKEIFTLVTLKYPNYTIIPICASHGALMLSIFLDKNPIFLNAIKKIIAWYPCLQYENIFYIKQSCKIVPLLPGSQELSIKMQKKFTEGKTFTPWGNFHITPDFYKNIDQYHSSFFESTTIPILILHGDKDSIVPIHYSKEIAKNNKNITLKIIKNASHSFEETIYKKEVIQKSLEFLQK